MNLKLIFTHDLHDRLEGFQRKEDGNLVEVGGYSRLYSKIKEERRGYEKTSLLVDAGDFSMGTLYQTIFKEEAVSLRMLGYMGYDLVTLGNHEFDFRAEGLAQSLKAAKDKGEDLPQLVFSNGILEDKDRLEEDENAYLLKEAFEEVGLEEYIIIEKNGIRIGIFGIMGESAIRYAPMAGIGFDDYIEVSKKLVKKLEAEDVDLIICLSHAGISEDLKRSEDMALAKKVAGIDIIISAHSHIEISEAIRVGSTTIVGAGSYGEKLGVLEIEEKDGDWKLVDYRLEKIDETIVEDDYIKAKTGYFKDRVQDLFLDNYGLKFDQVLAKTEKSFTPARKIGVRMEEDGLANLITDSYIHTIRELEGDSYEPITVSMVLAGIIRDSFYEGDITVADVFNVSALGVGKDGLSGYPLISAYLTGRELKLLAEVDASICSEIAGGQLYMSGLSYILNPYRNVLNKVTEVKIDLDKDIYMEIDDEKLYRVVAGLYTSQMMFMISERSYGLLKLVAKDKNGKPIENLEDHIIYTEDGMEVKEWYALAKYLESFKKEGEIPLIPDYYHQRQGRKLVDDDPGIVARLEKPNKLMQKIIAGIVSAAVTGLVAVSYLKDRDRRNK